MSPQKSRRRVFDRGKSGRISLQPLFAKRQHFARLAELTAACHSREEGRDGAHATALRRVKSMMTRDWSLLVLVCRFHKSRVEYVEMYSREAVVPQLIRLLAIYGHVLDVVNETGVEIDTGDFEAQLFSTIDALHYQCKRNIQHLEIEEPEVMTLREAEQRLQYKNILLDPVRGKLVLKDWQTAGARDLLDPERVVVTFEDGDEVEVKDNKLMEALGGV